MTVDFSINVAEGDDAWADALIGALSDLGVGRITREPLAPAEGPGWPVAVIVLSPRFFADPVCARSWPLLDSAAARGEIRLLPLLVERTPLPPPLRDYQYLDLTGTAPDAAAAWLRDYVRPMLSDEHPLALRGEAPVRIAAVLAPHDTHLAAPLAAAIGGLPTSRGEAVGVWCAFRPTAADDWARAITVSMIASEPPGVRPPHPDDADLVLVCLSRDLINQGYLGSEPFRQILRRQSAGRTLVVPVLVSDVSWDSLPPGHAPALPRGRPLLRWESLDQGLRSIADGIRQIITPRLPQPAVRNALAHTLDEVFKRSGAPTLTFVEPPDFDRFLSALRAPGRGIVLEGPSGIGKTTLLLRAIERLDPARHPVVLSGRRRADRAAIEELPDGHEGTVAVDDVHRLPADVRRDLVDYLKVLADEESGSKLILIGIPGTGDSLVELAHDVATRIDVFRLPAVSDATIEEMVRKGEDALNVEFVHRARVVLAAAGSLLTAQMLCWELAAGYRIEGTRTERTSIGADVGLVLDRVTEACARKYGPALRRLAALDGCVPLLAALRDSGSVGTDGVVRISEAEPGLRPGFDAIRAAGGLPADVAAHLHYEPGHLLAEDPQLLFYLRRLSVDRLYEVVGKRRPRSRDQVFVSYSHRDQAWLERLELHLRPLVHNGSIDVWSDRRVLTGDRWRDEIADALDRARIAILLVSSDFLASEFIASIELPSLLRAAASGGCRIVPVVVNPCLFSDLPVLREFQAANPDGRPLSGLSEHEQDETLLRVARVVKDHA
ncbi:TIR domain-containing protein [Cryptosporangium sp. NPDC051539]|uniref:TIR domain-containing protein n=1 Tax=Cryptosporangium sp. NPDC051539 TaxID=3363962 RepID=UPI00379B9F9E